ncbi:MAG: helix-turn-helix domain-containing protein [Pseudomonadota bacterium]
MSEVFESIKRGLEQALEHARGNDEIAIIHKPKPVTPIDVKKLREKLDLSEIGFANALNINLNTLRHWERGNRQPKGPALALLKVITERPEVMSILSQPLMMVVRGTTPEAVYSSSENAVFPSVQSTL